jgi:hypothetical protein
MCFPPADIVYNTPKPVREITGFKNKDVHLVGIYKNVFNYALLIVQETLQV